MSARFECTLCVGENIWKLVLGSSCIWLAFCSSFFGSTIRNDFAIISVLVYDYVNKTPLQLRKNCAEAEAEAKRRARVAPTPLSPLAADASDSLSLWFDVYPITSTSSATRYFTSKLICI
ncbi:hypothetical protein ACJJTC_017345 [Scirpophaga incertulas]